MNLLCKLLLALLLLGYFPARAEEVQASVGLICDTKEQVIAFNAAWNGSNEQALTVVNGSTDPPPCGILHVAYLKGETVGQVQNGGKTYDIVQITVVAINLGMGWIQGDPLIQFSLFLNEEREA